MAEGAHEDLPRSAPARLQYDFGRLQIYPKAASPIQPELAIGQPNDAYEQEADQIANRVMRMPEPPLPRDEMLSGLTLNSQGSQQRSKLVGIQTKPVDASSSLPLSAPPIVNEILDSPGQPLDAQTRAYFEPRFGQDFGRIRVHSDARAAESARALNALAYTNGRDIVLGTGQCSPATNFGRRLLAHELTHVTQYRNAPGSFGVRRGVGARGDFAEVEARLAANQLAAGLSIRPQARPSAALMLYTDEEDFDSEEFLHERPPNFTDQEVGSWGQSLPATLVARERLEVSFPAAERSNAILEAIFRREPLVIMHEYHRLWLYRLGWQGLSARYSRFTNSSTMFSQAPEAGGGYAVSNVTGRPEVEAFVTEDGGILSPPGAGKLFFHTGGEFEDPLVSGFENALAFIGGLQAGLESANFAGLAEQLRRMAALNTVFPAPFALGAAHGIASEVIGLAQWLTPAQWQAVEAAARQTILLLSDPDGEELATALGEEFGKSQTVALDKLLHKSLIVFAYEVGKLVGPVIVETVLGFIGIQIGPLAIVHKALELIPNAPRLGDTLRAAKNAFSTIPDRPGFPPRIGEEVIGDLRATKALPESPDLGVAADGRLPELSNDEKKLLATTGDPDSYPGALPKNLADQELDIVKRAEKRPIKANSDGYINEVDLGNGHKWQEKLDGTWCRFSNGATNCTRLVLTLGPQPPATVVATAMRKSLLREVYFEWAANRAPDNVEVALALHKASGTYAVVVGDEGYVRLPNNGDGWITIAHSHPGAPNQPGVINPSPRDLEVSLIGSFGRNTKRIRKWVHSQTPDGEWQEVEYGLDFETGRYYIQPSGGEPMYFDELQDPRLEESGLLDELQELNEELRIRQIGELNAEEFYAGWWARQFVWDD